MRYVDVLSIGLHELRNSMVALLQEPILFNGTVRQNLDPLDKASDDDLWRALESASMKEVVLASGLGLECDVAESGANWSVGEKSLLCLARALLKKETARVVVLDEPTASVDLDTDAIVQAAVRKHFARATMISIAHRLSTIIDSSLIVVLEDGALKEAGTPHALIEDPRKSAFMGMVEATGGAVAASLVASAKRHHDERAGATE